jgi:hypothetical protein
VHRACRQVAWAVWAAWITKPQIPPEPVDTASPLLGDGRGDALVHVLALSRSRDGSRTQHLLVRCRRPERTPQNAYSRTTARRRSIRQKSFGARRRCFDRYLSSGLGRSQKPVPRAATISARPTQRVLRPKRRCGIASLIIVAATSYVIREPASISHRADSPCPGRTRAPLSAWKAQAIVKRLGAIHDLGSMDVSRGFGRD